MGGGGVCDNPWTVWGKSLGRPHRAERVHGENPEAGPRIRARRVLALFLPVARPAAGRCPLGPAGFEYALRCSRGLSAVASDIFGLSEAPGSSWSFVVLQLF